MRSIFCCMFILPNTLLSPALGINKNEKGVTISNTGALKMRDPILIKIILIDRYKNVHSV